MAANPDLSFRRLREGEAELAAALAGGDANYDDPRSVNFGVAGAALPFHGEEAWGLFIKGSLCGAAWFKPPNSGWAEVAGLILAKDWWNTGLAPWMLAELSRTAELAGGLGVVVKIGQASPAAGEALADAGFDGPDPEAEGYPVGEWRRPAGAKSQF